jgi:excinuclease UvrABC nuclease subunit
MVASKLDEIEGIGKMRKIRLLSSFDNIEDIKNASVEKLKSLGIPLTIIAQLKEQL